MLSKRQEQAFRLAEELVADFQRAALRARELREEYPELALYVCGQSVVTSYESQALFMEDRLAEARKLVEM